MNPPEQHGFPWMDDLLCVVLMITASLFTGFVVNQFRDHPLTLVYEAKAARLDKAVHSFSAEAKSVQASMDVLPAELSLNAFEAFMKQGKGLVLDARPEIFHRSGHVPGALSLPREDFEAAYTRLREKIEADYSRPIAVYCSGVHCDDAEMVKSALRKLGYIHVGVFKGGWDEWMTAHPRQESR